MTNLVYKNYTFGDSAGNLVSATALLSQSLISDKLSADEFTAVVTWPDLNTLPAEFDGDNNAFVKDTPIDIYNNGQKIGRFYVQSIYPIKVTAGGVVFLQINALSLIGLTVYMSHVGGMYTNAKAGDVIAEILGATYNSGSSTATLLWYDITNTLHYTIDATVANTRIDGHLPMTDGSRSARDNLREVLFVTGASVLKDAEGSVRFTFNQPDTPIAIATPTIYQGDRYVNDDAAGVTAVKVIQNQYFAWNDVEPVVEFETTEVVDHKRVIFDEPVFSVYSSQVGGVDTLTIHEYGVNYAVVSGTGTLYGKPYTNTQVEYSEQIRTGVETSRTAQSGLISLLNYKNVLDRMAAWYRDRKTVANSFVLDGTGIKPGSLVSFLDPLNRSKQGFVQDLTMKFSGIVKGDANIVTGWLPTNVGNNFTMSQQKTGSGTWSKADAEAAVGHPITLLRIDLIAGGDGGQAGEDGTAGNKGGPGVQGGKGGAPGTGGLPGRVYSITLEGDQIPATINYYCGTGGQPGQNGTNTTVVINGTSYHSSAGTRPIAGYMNILTGQIYAEQGPDGIPGGDGGSDGETGEGESVTYKGRTWNAGTYGGTDQVTRWELRQSGGYYYADQIYGYARAFGGLTGGAAFGASSANGQAGALGTKYYFTGSSKVIGVASAVSQGGTDGADALPIDDYTPTLGSGGAGGNGGGGGGASMIGENSGGYRFVNNQPQTVPANNNAGDPGDGGAGSLGTAGGNGFVNFYF